jgi:hypothetical protein
MGPAGAMGLEEDGADALFGAGAVDAAPALWATEGLPQPIVHIEGIRAANPKTAPRIRLA